MGVESTRIVLPAVTRAVVYHSADDLRLEDVPLPAIGHGDLLIRIRACGLCPGETMEWYMARKAPLVLGHEPVGEVIQAGKGATAFAPGDRVFVHHHAPCMNCRACRRGDYVHCATWRNSKLIPGGLAHYALVRDEIVRADTLRLPEAISDDVATFIEPLACAVKSVRRAGLRPGDRVLVLGLGVMGVLHIMLARRLGAELIIGADRVPSRVARALEFGADVAINVTSQPLPEAVWAHTDGAGADVVIVGPGTIEAIEMGYRSVAPGGTLLLFTPTPPEQHWPLPVHDAYFREVRVIPSYSTGPAETKEALRWLEEGLPVERLITHRYPLEQAIEGYRLVLEATDALKVVVYP